MYRHPIRYATRKLRMTQPVLQINFPNERSMWATPGLGTKVSHHPRLFQNVGRNLASCLQELQRTNR